MVAVTTWYFLVFKKSILILCHRIHLVPLFASYHTEELQPVRSELLYWADGNYAVNQDWLVSLLLL